MDEMADEKVCETKYNSSTFDFSERSSKTDFILIVGGTVFHVSKHILAFASPVFDRMFESKFKESTSDELELPGKKADHVNEFLLAIYPNTAFPISKENALKVLPLAEEYQVLSLKQRCEEAVIGGIDRLTVTEELYRLIKEAHLYNLDKLQKRCVSLVCEKSTEEIERENREIVIPGKPLSDILQNLNDRHVSRIKELESSNKYLASQLKTFRTWKEYFSKDFALSDFPNLDEDIAMLRETWMFTIDVKNRNVVEDTVIIWNRELEIKFEFTQTIRTSSVIYAKLVNTDKKEIKCAFAIQFVFLNKVNNEGHLSVKRKFQFSSGQQSTRYDIGKVADIEDPKKGFVHEGKVQIEVNVIMSEPKDLEK